MNRFVLLVSLLACALTLSAQGQVKGKVIDKQSDEALQYVNVTITNVAGKMIKGTVTDIKGSFSLDGISNGNYTLNVSYVGYKTATRKFSINANNRSVSYPAIFLSEDSRVLKEVSVTGQRSQMKLEVDRKSFTVDQVLAASGGSASDLLENIPSVEVTTDGEISLRGNSSVEVWINGKSSGLTSDNRAEILQQIPAESIEKIEVIDNPSAKYSAEGGAGIINIILKKDRRAGYYGSLQSGVNNNKGWNIGGNINYTSKTWDAFANVGYRRRRGEGGSLSEQQYLKTNTYQNYRSESEDKGGGLFARAGVTWHATAKDDISLSGMTMQGTHNNLSSTPYYYGAIGNNTPDYMMFRRNEGDGDMHMYHGELAYTHNFSDKHKLDATLSFNRWTSDHDNIYRDSTVYYSPVQPSSYLYQYRPMFVRNRSWEAKLEYENQITDNFKIEAGYNGNFSHENTPQESWTAPNWAGTNTIEDETYYNRFIYDMDVHALYATATTKIGKLGVMAGLRGEYWRVNTESYNFAQEHGTQSADAPFKKDYFQLFPSLFLNYPLTSSAQLQLNYTRRLRRPWGGQLNNFKNTRDASMVEFGNPELTPEYSHSFSLNFLKTWTDHTLSVSTYYRPTTDVIQRIRYQGEDNVMYSTNENVAKSQSAGIELIGKDKLFRILDLTTTINAYYYKLDGFNYTINNQLITGKSDENFSWDARLLASLILPYDISVQATGNYRSRTVITQGYRKANASLDLGIRKSLFNKALTVALNWRDVFNTRHWETYTSSDTFTRYQKNWRDPRINLQLTWNFGNMSGSKKKPQEELNGGDSELQNYGGYEQ